MRALIQRVKQAELFVDNQLVSSIDSGLLVLLGIADGDTKKEVSYIVKKITNLRIFEDDAGKMKGSLLIVDFPSRKDLEDYLANEPYILEKVWEEVEVESMNVVIVNSK